jgi:hypothetical protein
VGEERAEAAGVSEHSIRSSRSDGQESASLLEEHDNSRSSSRYVQSTTIKAPSTKPALRKRKKKTSKECKQKKEFALHQFSSLLVSVSQSLCVCFHAVVGFAVLGFEKAGRT